MMAELARRRINEQTRTVINDQCGLPLVQVVLEQGFQILGQLVDNRLNRGVRLGKVVGKHDELIERANLQRRDVSIRRYEKPGVKARTLKSGSENWNSSARSLCLDATRSWRLAKVSCLEGSPGAEMKKKEAAISGEEGR